MVQHRSRAAALILCAVALGATACSSTPAQTPSAASSPVAVPAPTSTVATIESRAADAVAEMSMRERLGSLLMIHVAGTDPAPFQQAIAEVRPGGVILMGDNVGASSSDVAALVASFQDADLPLLVSIDQEGGVVSRLPEDDLPAGAALADAGPEATASTFAARGALVAQAGANVNFGVVADVTADGSSFIASRTLGATPDAASANVAAAVAGENNAGVLSTLKHFPGHGAAPGDSHTSLPETPETYDEWKASDAIPFRGGIEAGAEVVMFGHLVYSAVDSRPASLSPRWHEILRDDLGFAGLTVSDDLGMLENSGDPAYADRVTNAVAALNAGTSMLLFVADSPTSVPPPSVLAGLEAAVADGRLSDDVVTASATHVMIERLRLAEGH